VALLNKAKKRPANAAGAAKADATAAKTPRPSDQLIKSAPQNSLWSNIRK